jgi:hypothetical protein
VVSKFLELSGSVVMPPSIEEVRSDSHEISVVASPPSQSHSFEKSGVVDVAASLSPESDKHVISFGDDVAKSGLLATVSGAVVTREGCDFFATLATSYPRSAVD